MSIVEEKRWQYFSVPKICINQGYKSSYGLHTFVRTQVLSHLNKLFDLASIRKTNNKNTKNVDEWIEFTTDQFPFMLKKKTNSSHRTCSDAIKYK